MARNLEYSSCLNQVSRTQGTLLDDAGLERYSYCYKSGSNFSASLHRGTH